MEALKKERGRVKEDEEKGSYINIVKCQLLLFSVGFHVSMKMKRAAVALCANDVDYRRRGKTAKKLGQSTMCQMRCCMRGTYYVSFQ